jgi:hypothetical protein
LLAAGPANAAPVLYNSIVSNLTADAAAIPLSVPTGSTRASPVGQEFTATDATITALTLRLQDTTNDQGSVIVYLVPDNGLGTFPAHTGGDTLTNRITLATLSDSSIFTTSTGAGCSFGGAAPSFTSCNTVISLHQAITAGNWWIVLASAADPNNGNGGADTSAVWWRDNENGGVAPNLNPYTGIGTAGESRISTSFIPNPDVLTMSRFTNGEMEMKINNAPEPASLALLGAVMMVLGLIRRKVRNRRS